MTDDLQPALERLYALRRLGIKPGLEVERELIEHLDHPERAYRIVHVAGTNGKGSVCALIASVLREVGLRVGLYTSPHLVRFGERIRIDGIPIGDDAVGALLARIEPFAARIAAVRGRQPTFFECTTAMAFEAFRSAAVDVAVLETGMGGRLDATNVVDPLVTVITAIGLEHTDLLGTDIGSIAHEKAGIIKAGRPVVIGPMDAEPRAVIMHEANRMGSTVVDAAGHATVSVNTRTLQQQTLALATGESAYGRIRLPLLGDHQLENAATAAIALEVFAAAAGMALDPAALKSGFESVTWPGRFQVLQDEPPLILDGAHNAHAARVLGRTLQQIFPGRPVGLVLGMCGDKNAHGFLAPFAERLRKVWLVPVKSERNMAASELRRAVPRGNVTVEGASPAAAMTDAVRWAGREGGVVCVTGSLFLVGEVLAIRGQ